jgi:hypothetical protein
MSAKKFRGWCTNGCGQAIKQRATKYCSFKCRQDFNFRLRVHLVESGCYQVRGGYTFLRKLLIKRLGEKCSKCGWAQRHKKTGKVPIEVEHIDGDWQNNKLNNLTLLCPNCHALTPTFRGLNRGRGRAYRLGGRCNPIGATTLKPAVAPAVVPQPATPETTPPKKVLGQRLTQLHLFVADVAERSIAPDL